MAKLKLSMSLALEWDKIDVIRQSATFAVAAALDDEDTGERIGMVVSELLENAYKYGRPGAAVELRLEAEADEIEVVATNELADSLHHDGLVSRLVWIASFDDPRSAYEKALEGAFEELTEGGLGLVRIAYEGECAVESRSTEAGAIEVRARTRRKRRVQE